MYDKVIIIGVLISVIYSELTGLSSGGLVVPGYIALNINNPMRLAYTFLIVTLTYFIVKGLSKYLIIYGKRRFAIMVAVAMLLNLGFIGADIFPTTPSIIGHIIPGIIANEWEKEGVMRSLMSLGIVSGILVLIMLLFGMPVF